MQLPNRLDHIDWLAASSDTNGQTDAAVVNQQGQKIQESSSHPLAELEINLSDVVRVFGTQQLP